jgi:protein-S-isoprenylcysteine O-methyltransferase Ste14
MFLGVPILAWGTNDIYIFLNSGPRLFYAAAVVISSWISAKYMANSNSRTGKKHINRQHYILILMQLLCLLILAVGPYCNRRELFLLSDSITVQYVGLMIYILGAYFSGRSEYILGENFSKEVTIQKNHKLITCDIYKHIRHPRYLGVLVMMIGISVIFDSVADLFLCIILYFVMLDRIRDEEFLLAKEFRTEWEEYVRKSWRFIPHVY